MYSVFIRDVVIAVLLSIITAMLIEEPCVVFCMPLGYLFSIMGIEMYLEKLIRTKRIKGIIKKLRSRKVLPPASKQD